MPYAAEISRANPTCFLFLVDQSRSMLGPLAGRKGRRKADAVADSINRLLYTLVLRCVWGQAVLDRFHIGVLGYGRRGGPGRAGLPVTGDPRGFVFNPTLSGVIRFLDIGPRVDSKNFSRLDLKDV